MSVRVYDRVFLPALLAACLLASCSYFRPEPGIEDTVEALNKKCPAMIDSETRLDSITLGAPKSLNYHYTLVNLMASRVDTHDFRLALAPGLLSTIKLSPDMKKLRDENMIIRYYYRDKQGQAIIHLAFGPEEYR